MNTGKAHGAALGDDEVAAVKRELGFDPDKTFEVRDEVIAHTRKLVARGKEAHEKWQTEFDAWAQREPERKALLDRLTAEELPEGWDADIPTWTPEDKPLATRAASGKVLNAVAPEAAGAVGRLGGPGRQQQHHDGQRQIVWAPVDFDKGLHRRLVRPHIALRDS